MTKQVEGTAQKKLGDAKEVLNGRCQLS
jgi:uncharacterized protein YjbJ (UPF0337 family)